MYQEKVEHIYVFSKRPDSWPYKERKETNWGINNNTVVPQAQYRYDAIQWTAWKDVKVDEKHRERLRARLDVNGTAEVDVEVTAIIDSDFCSRLTDYNG